jgi:hypothetical protein
MTMFTVAALLFGQTAPPLKSVDEVLVRYQQALGGVDAIGKVESETSRGEIEDSNVKGKSTFVAYAKPFKSIFKVTRPDGHETVSGFDGQVSWTVTPEGVASIDKDTPVESDRRDADLQYALHQRDYFQKLEFEGVTDFDGRRCYWLHGTTHWGKDNNQFYDVETGLLAGYRFQSDSSSSAVVIVALFKEYKNFGGPLVATKRIISGGNRTRTLTILSVTYEPLQGSVFELPKTVKALVK